MNTYRREKVQYFCMRKSTLIYLHTIILKTSQYKQGAIGYAAEEKYEANHY